MFREIGKELSASEAARLRMNVSAVSQAVRATRQLCPEGPDKDLAMDRLQQAWGLVEKAHQTKALGNAPKIEPPKKPVGVEPLSYTIP